MFLYSGKCFNSHVSDAGTSCEGSLGFPLQFLVDMKRKPRRRRPNLRRSFGFSCLLAALGAHSSASCGAAAVRRSVCARACGGGAASLGRLGVSPRHRQVQCKQFLRRQRRGSKQTLWHILNVTGGCSEVLRRERRLLLSLNSPNTHILTHTHTHKCANLQLCECANVDGWIKLISFDLGVSSADIKAGRRRSSVCCCGDGTDHRPSPRRHRDQ